MIPLLCRHWRAWDSRQNSVEPTGYASLIDPGGGYLPTLVDALGLAWTSL